MSRLQFDLKLLQRNRSLFIQKTIQYSWSLRLIQIIFLNIEGLLCIARCNLLQRLFSATIAVPFLVNHYVDEPSELYFHVGRQQSTFGSSRL